MLKECNGKDVHPETICRALHEIGLHGRTGSKKPFFSEINRKRD